jgi:hypothetical protein
MSIACALAWAAVLITLPVILLLHPSTLEIPSRMFRGCHLPLRRVVITFVLQGFVHCIADESAAVFHCI